MESSSFGRLFGVLFSPGKTFRSIAERPTWALALLVLLVLSGVVGFLGSQRMDYRDLFTQKMREAGQEVSEEQLDRQVSFMEKAGGPISAGGAAVGVAVISLIGALFYWLAFKLLGSEFSYKTSFAVTLHAAMPVAVSLLLSLPVILSRQTITYGDMKRSGGTYLQSNLAFLAPEGAPAWQIALYACVDFFSLWSLALSVIGFRAVTRKSTQSVAVTVFVIWLLFVAVRVGLASLG